MSGFASPPCFAPELEGAERDPQQALDVARWRKAERRRLIAARKAMASDARERTDAAISMALATLIEDRLGDVSGRAISAWLPILGEPDLRPLMASLHERGARVLLPVVERRAAPLVFRRWAPGAKLERGIWNILVPTAEAERAEPELALAPLVGWDGAGYRLGYGGGYFDRTLAALASRPFVIGVGLQAARLPTISPQWHDVPMDAIVTEAGVQPLEGDSR